MKPLHASSQVTASDSRMVVRVVEISTPDGPVRRIVVEVNAEMSPDEVRELISRLTDAVAIAEANDKPRQHPLTEFCFHCASDNMLARGISLHDERQPWDGPTVHMQTPESFCPRMNDRPAVSEDQPKPRVGALALAPDWDDKTNNVVIERVDANGCQVTNSQGQSWWVGMDRIEVLADSEQVTADPADRPEWTCTNCGTEGNPGTDDRCGCCGGHRWEFDSEQVTR